MDFVSSARMSIRRMTSDVLVPSCSKSLAVRSLSSAGTRTWIKLLVLLASVVVLMALLYDNVMRLSRACWSIFLVWGLNFLPVSDRLLSSGVAVLE